MIFEHWLKNKKILFLIFILLLLGGILFFVWQKISEEEKVVLCAQEAKLCPDGSSVGRTGPDCEFAPCPRTETANGWINFSNEQQGIEFKYPETLSASYVIPAEWPPQVSITTGTFICVETSPASSLPERTMKRLVDNRPYCVEAASEGAAGSVYTDYTYTTSKNDKLIIIKFALRYPQCGNYDDPARIACEKERETFDLDDVIDRIAASAREREQ